MNAEETMFSEGLPVNTLALLERFKEIIKENNTNTILGRPDDVRVRMIFWVLIEHLKQYYWDIDKEVVDHLMEISNIEWDNLREHPEVKSMLVANELKH